MFCRFGSSFFSVFAISLFLAPIPYAAESGFQSVLSGHEMGVRAMGMGGAFVAVADDGSASYWNPAGLAFTKARTVELMSSSVQATGFAGYGYILYSQPDTGRGAGALSFAYTGIDFDPGFWIESVVSYSCAFKRGRDSALGLTLKYIRVDSSLEFIPDEGSKKVGAWGMGFDIGVLAKLGGTNLGILARDLLSILRWNSGSRERIPSSISVGVALLPIEGVVMSVQLDGNTRIGIGRAAAGIDVKLLPIPIWCGAYWKGGVIDAFGITGGTGFGISRWGAHWRMQIGIDMNTALEEGALKLSLGAEF